MRLKRKVIMRHVVSLRIPKDAIDLLDEQANKLGITRSSGGELAIALLANADKAVLEDVMKKVKVKRRKVKARPRHDIPDIFA